MTWQSEDSWRIIQAPETNGSDYRSPERLLDVVRQFNVEKHKRYQPDDNGATKCNIFVWDCTKALSCEIPHWLHSKELNANATHDWLLANGPKFGWQQVPMLDADVRARAGFPTIAIWKNLNGIGHVAMVVPTPDRAGIRIAQAGRRNYADAALTAGFGINKTILFYTHE